MTSATGSTSTSSSGSASPATAAAAGPRSAGSELVSSQGRTSIADSVVQKIAGIAAREVSGVYDLGGGASRAFGAIKGRIPVGSAGPSVSQGVAVEVGEKQAAIDLDVVVEYGVAIADLAQSIRRNVIGSVERMTGLEVTEVNVSVDDIHIAGSEDEGSAEPARVQ
jgi:uncharacterized alkaline shock family protein YloU